MIFPAHRRDIQTDHIHIAALRTEIGERLVIGLGKEPVGMPLHLMLLMSRWRDEPSEARQSETVNILRPANDDAGDHAPN